MLLRDVKKVLIAQNLVTRTVEALRSFGQTRCEGLVLWLGTSSGYEARISDAWIPPQTPIRSESGVGYMVSGETLTEISRECRRKGVGLVAQVHSHPGRAYHSSADDRYAVVTTNGGFSLVVPNFGAGPAHIATWAVYRLKGRDWAEMTPREVASTFIVESTPASSGPESTSVWA